MCHVCRQRREDASTTVGVTQNGGENGNVVAAVPRVDVEKINVARLRIDALHVDLDVALPGLQVDRFCQLHPPSISTNVRSYEENVAIVISDQAQFAVKLALSRFGSLLYAIVGSDNVVRVKTQTLHRVHARNSQSNVSGTPSSKLAAQSDDRFVTIHEKVVRKCGLHRRLLVKQTVCPLFADRRRPREVTTLDS